MAIDTATLMKEVGRIRLLTRRLMDDQLSGDYHSTFKGQGVEFDESRPYQPGDDVRKLDWNVTARTGIAHVKRFNEERELTILFVVDVSGSQSFGSSGHSKATRAAEITALLAMTALQNQDKVGLLLFSDRIVKALPPRKGRTAVQRLVREVLATEETREGTNIKGAIDYILATQHRKAVIFFVSDFRDSAFERSLAMLARRHDLIACTITDPAEQTLPNVGLIELFDPETHETFLVDTSSKATRDAFEANEKRRMETLHKRLLQMGADTLHITTHQPYIKAVRDLFHRRALQRH
jgi:uncharacterized protein (DUF58 family)